MIHNSRFELEEPGERIVPSVPGGGNPARSANPEGTANPEGRAVPAGIGLRPG